MGRSKIFKICGGTLWDLDISLVPSGFGGVSLRERIQGLEDHCCPELCDPHPRLWGRREPELFLCLCRQEHHDPWQNGQEGGRETLQFWSLLAEQPACLQLWRVTDGLSQASVGSGVDGGCHLLDWRKSISALVQVTGTDRSLVLPRRDGGRSIGAVQM